jgi:hypothetical protein
MRNRQLLQSDDFGTEDIMAYTQANKEEEDNDSIFSAGGAIMEALSQQNPGIKKQFGFKIEPVVVKGNKIIK